jgi:2-oxoglutarate ferredoxin oxidoreductase subunit beta
LIHGLNELPAIDLARKRYRRATFVAAQLLRRREQVQTLLGGGQPSRTALLDIITVRHVQQLSVVEQELVREGHEIPLQEIDFVPRDAVVAREEITVGDYAEGEIITVELHDGSIIRLKKLDKGHDPRNRMEAIRVLEEAQREQLFVTGLIYYEEPRPVLSETLHVTDTRWRG